MSKRAITPAVAPGLLATPEKFFPAVESKFADVAIIGIKLIVIKMAARFSSVYVDSIDCA